MEDAYMGSIMLFAGTFEPQNWMFCNGQILSINDYQALFSILGATYGGDGRSTFALPDLRSRFAVHPGAGPGLSPKQLGQRGGQEAVTLMETQMPTHTHAVTSKLNAKEEANSDEADSNYIAGTGNQIFGTTKDVEMNSTSVEVTLQNAGSNLPHENLPPFLGLNYIICINGLYPPRH